MKEIWKDIDGYPLYEVSNLGNVRTKEHTDACNRFKKAKLRKPRNTATHHQYVTLFSQEARKYRLFFVHKLVAIAFLPNPHNYPIINHKDCDPTNNHASNLEWCTYSYNNTYKDAISKRNATRLKNNPNRECWQKTALHRNKPIVQYNTSMQTIREYPSIKEACKENSNFNRSNISSALTGKTKTAYGYIWKFKSQL
jgi:hypothetical protein